MHKIERITFSSVGLLLTGLAFAVTIAQWMHEGGHLLGAVLTKSEIREIHMWPPWQAYVVANYTSKSSMVFCYVNGFLVTFLPFTFLFAISLNRMSKCANFFLFPLFTTIPTSQGDLNAIGIQIP